MSFDAIYATDLVYVKDCWRLCGDAHCCSFARHKAKFAMMAKKPFQELPLLPGEYDFLARKGWLEQFGAHEHRVTERAISGQVVSFETLVTHRSQCPCEHDIRPTVCRLYPLMPVFNVAGHVTGLDTAGIFEDLEVIDGQPPLCKLEAAPFKQVDAFLAITSALAESPLLVFSMMAYRVGKAHVRERLAARKAQFPAKSAFALFEGSFLTKKLFDLVALDQELAALVAQFHEHYGARFELASSSAGALPGGLEEQYAH
jgi:hypothetical protein